MDGQRKLKAGSVLCIGAGGLGSPAAMYLAAAGIGRIGIVDFDVVDFSNLQRQLLHGDQRRRPDEAGVGEGHAQRAQPARAGRHLRDGAVVGERAASCSRGYDVILDGTDNFPTRYLVNDACVLTGKPNAYGSIFRFEGQASVFATKDGPCYRCLYPEPPPPGLVPSCAEGGVLGVLPGIIGVIQATESDQADPRHRRAADRPLPDLRRAEDAVPRAEAAEGSGVPGVRHESDRDQAD